MGPFPSMKDGCSYLSSNEISDYIPVWHLLRHWSICRRIPSLILCVCSVFNTAASVRRFSSRVTGITCFRDPRASRVRGWRRCLRPGATIDPSVKVRIYYSPTIHSLKTRRSSLFRTEEIATKLCEWIDSFKWTCWVDSQITLNDSFVNQIDPVDSTTHWFNEQWYCWSLTNGVKSIW